MSVATLPFEAAAAAAVIDVHGIGRIGYIHDGQKTRLKDLYQSDPIRVLFPRAARGDIANAVFVTTSGGLVGGDKLELAASAGPGVQVQIAAQAAEKIYRSTGADCRISVSLEVGDGAWLEWLPQETIVFDGGRLVRRTQVDVRAGGRLLAGEMLVLGRSAMGETLVSGLVREDWQVHRHGRAVWADALCLEGDIASLISHPAGLAGATAVATIIYVADDAADHLDTARALLPQTAGSLRGGASLVNGVLLVRFLAADGQQLRAAFGDFWSAFRQAAAGLPAQMPRLWNI